MALFGKKDNTKDSSKEKVDKKKNASAGSPQKGGQAVKAKVAKKDTTTTTSKTVKHGMAFKVLVKPLVTEKVAVQAESGKYTFEVDKSANKVEIAKAIKEVYGVKVEKVNIVNMEGKKKRMGRVFGKRKDWKKAIVTLEKGKAINVYEGV